MNVIFERRVASGEIVREIYSDGSFYIEISDKDTVKKIPLYTVNARGCFERNIYLGHTMEEVLASGKDILGEDMIKNGDPIYSDVKKVMPEITKEAYCFLASPASWSGVTVDTMGNVIPQRSGKDVSPAPIFRPEAIDERLGKIKPRQHLVGGEYPILISVHTDGVVTLELTYFVEPGDTEPVVWIREKKYNNEAPEATSIVYRDAGKDFGLSEEEMNKIHPSEESFLEVLADTLLFWVKFSEGGAQISVPEPELMRVYRGAMAFAVNTFTAHQPHYGHRYYGLQTHDNFPPNYIWSIEAACISGRTDFARGVFNHFINYALNANGSIYYRQGAHLLSGASAAEYGMLLWLFEKYSNILMQNKDEKILKKVSGMGDVILSKLVECPEFGGRAFIKMCAEADNNVRVNVYLNNNLWAIRGLESLARIIANDKAEKYLNTAKVLRQNIESLIEEYAKHGTPYGDVPPFRFGYPAIPYTLSNCEKFSAKVSDEEKERYFKTVKGRRDFDVTDQEITENTYANYRYYPEILGSMLLPENYADGISKMRDELGGNLLGMTRFRSWIDNWPVLNYARFLIESGMIEKYLLLLYAHTAHHGHPELMCYYEQIKVWGEVSANDCLPSLLTTPIMLTWVFAYERVADGRLTLLSALPKAWYSSPFSAHNIGYSGGRIDLCYDGRLLTVDFENPIEDDFEIVWRSEDLLTIDNVTIGRKNVKEIKRNALIIKGGIKHVEISVN